MLVGSRALKLHNPNVQIKDTTDWDFIGQQTCEVPEGSKIEIYNLGVLNNAKAKKLFDENGICSLRGLALLKRSHLHRDLRFAKHITYYHKFILPLLGDSFLSSLSPAEDEFLQERIKLTKKHYPYHQISLKKSNSDFFDDAVTKIFDHDHIHEVVAQVLRPNGTPLYLRLKINQESAYCEKTLWLSLTEQEKAICVLEETYVIALERFVLRDTWVKSEMMAFNFALEKVCTTLTSGWFRDFAIDNYAKLKSLYDHRVISKVKRILLNETVVNQC